ncbi:MAG: purine-nucleoside phosphorylase [Mobiluncus porci]|uniref:purine-nucleoside phosphorylase n=1 Tax=Mobiluncus porci TaxID=2652278 RepID=UPI0023F11CBB|nr:purine-nucleoside phosphorylase [Mobiluncus porci]MDD7541241.1 purine-nucleoside phosphorylase [Mobiluncus porci]MDY5747946.1 purine-nucleoside phosphorylase [Mobiluncus porci]
MPTPHNSAKLGDFAPALLMPGDPLRARRIAETVLADSREVTSVRGNSGFTGTYQGRPLSVMASGMGMPSLTIYATELFRDYGVKRIIRVGTCGGLSAEMEVGDVVVALGAHTDSHMNVARFPEINYAPVASWPLLEAAMREAPALEAEGVKVHVGSIMSNDHFYFTPDGLNERLAQYGTLAVEMETAGLYAVAAEFGAEALTVLTVSDHLLVSGPEMTHEERETRFAGALRLALAAAMS